LFRAPASEGSVLTLPVQELGAEKVAGESDSSCVVCGVDPAGVDVV
jgi:hypothetical protein